MHVLGQVYEATRTGPSAINVDGTMDYTYNSTGDRATAVHTTPFNKVKWEYSDYVTLGTADSPKRVFTVMQRYSDGGNNTWNLTNDRFRYSFDVAGRMLWARFAPTPQSGKTVADADPWASFVQADYSYDAGGRTLSIGYAKNVLNTNGTSYTVTNLRGYEAVYASQLALKSQTKTFNGNGTGWTEDTSKAQSYGYDADYDYLTSANYNGSTDTWTYDPAGNRKSYNSNTGFVYDNLNRMTASKEKNSNGTFSAHTFSYNSGVGLLGFRWYRDYSSQAAVRKTDWNDLGQMSACRGSTYQGSTVGSKYEYLPGGMRVTKVDGIVMDAQLDDQGNVSGYYDVTGGTNKPTTRYYYDGQMPVAEDFTRLVSGVTKVDKDWYGLGARGIDWQQHYDAVSDATSVVFPLYDTHGNNVGSVSRSGSNDFAVSNERTYDAWGAIKTGNNYPQQGYCASLGHRQDDESSLVYMRARYYEPSTGRFVSEDPAMDGVNWFTYAGGDPVNFADRGGCERVWITIGDYEVSFDWYYPKGSSDPMGDVHWRKIGESLPDGRGSWRSDGVLKEGEAMPEDLRELLARGEGRAGRKHHNMSRSLGIAVDSIRAAFQVDPIATLEIILMAIQGIDLVWNRDGWGT